MLMEQKRVAGFSTPSSGRKCGPKAARLDDDDEMVPVMGEEAEFVPLVGGGGGEWSGGVGGGSVLTFKVDGGAIGGHAGEDETNAERHEQDAERDRRT